MSEKPQIISKGSTYEFQSQKGFKLKNKKKGEKGKEEEKGCEWGMSLWRDKRVDRRRGGGGGGGGGGGKAFNGRAESIDDKAFG